MTDNLCKKGKEWISRSWFNVTLSRGFGWAERITCVERRSAGLCEYVVVQAGARIILIWMEKMYKYFNNCKHNQDNWQPAD